MKKLYIILIIALGSLFSAFTFSDPTEWQLTDQYSIRFKGKGINGFFHTLKGKINFDEKNLAASKFQLEAEVKSITTGLSLKSWNAKRKKWFNAKEFPSITFNSNKIQKTQRGYIADGTIKMKGIEKPVAIPFSFSNNIFFGNFYVKRSDFKVGKTKGFGKMVADSILVEFTITVKK